MAQVRSAPAQGRFNRNPKSAATLTALVALLSACPAAHADPSLALADAERIAIQRDAMLQQLAVDSWSFTAEDMTMVEVGVSQEFPAGRTRELSRKRMEQIATASQAAAGERRRIAAPMVGGMVSATVLTLVIIPSLYLIVNGWRLRDAVD